MNIQATSDKQGMGYSGSIQNGKTAFRPNKNPDFLKGLGMSIDGSTEAPDDIQEALEDA